MIIDLDTNQLRTARTLFGQPIELYGPIVSVAINRASKAAYPTEVSADPSDTIASWNREVAQQVLRASHLSATTSIVRASRWFEAAWREYEANNFLGFASCARSLLEAVGDAAFSLNAIGPTLLVHQSKLRLFIDGHSDEVLGMEEVEKVLVHFNRARKLTGAEKGSLPAEYNAEQTVAYINFLQSTGVSDAKKLYSELCHVGHPASGSVEYLHVHSEGVLSVDPYSDSRKLAEIRERYSRLFADLPAVAFNPGLLILKALHRFDGFPSIPELRKFDFQGAKAGAQVASLMRQ